jgi:hypothetical protein
MNLAQIAGQRKHPRVDVSWSVIMLTPEGKMVGKTENISCGGAYIRCSTLLCKNDLFTITIQAPNREPLHVGAEVVWVDIPLTPDKEQVPIGMGVRFTDISVDDLQFISNVVAGVTKD